MLTSLSPATRRKEFHLPIDEAKACYGASADTADRDLRELRDAEILTALTIYIPCVLAATGWVERHMQQLQKQFGIAVPVDISTPQGIKEVPVS